MPTLREEGLPYLREIMWKNFSRFLRKRRKRRKRVVLILLVLMTLKYLVDNVDNAVLEYLCRFFGTNSNNASTRWSVQSFDQTNL
ncbi:hypothetical protein DL98DRAFT_136778 [Cadophora sp. DSE1049]|nr:hypothetical protein DL98DRAFT_136778 [Cadophora sp. DSE1049]